MSSALLSGIIEAASSSADERTHARLPSQSRFQEGERSLIELNLSRKRPHNNWTRRQRLLLCCLRRFFHLTREQETTIFNTVFIDEWADLRTRRHEVWKQVHLDTDFSKGPRLFAETFLEITQASQKVGIQLEKRSNDSLDTSRFSHRGAGRNTRSANIDTEDHEAADEPSARLPPESPVPRHTQAFRSIHSPMPCRSTPKLLWRFANDNSQGINHKNGYVAYVFTDRLGSIPSPKEYTRETFRAMVENHARIHQIPSPFISTSVDPLVAIHRALRREDHATVSLVDTTQLHESLIFSMHELMNQYDIKTRGYTGRKEYPIWGAISKSALVLTFRIDELLKIAEEHADIKAVLKLDLIAEARHYWTTLTEKLKQGNAETGPGAGRAIGKLLRLLDLPPDYVDDVAEMLNRSWKFVLEDNLNQFFRGVWQGFEENSMPNENQTSGGAKQLCFRPDLWRHTIPQPVATSAGTYANNEDLVSGKALSSLALSKTAKSLRRDSSKQPEVDTSGDDEDEDFIFVDTPCPSRHRSKETIRPARFAAGHTATLPSSEISRGPWPVMTKLQTYNKRKRSVCNIQMYEPNTGSWVQARPSPSKKPAAEKNMESKILDEENDYTVIEDGEPEQERREEADMEIKIEQSSDEDRIDDENEEGFNIIDHHEQAPPSPASSAGTLEEALTPDERFDLDRARVTRTLELYRSWREPQPTTAETPPTSASSSFLSFGSASTPASSSYHSSVDLQEKETGEMMDDFYFFS